MIRFNALRRDKDRGSLALGLVIMALFVSLSVAVLASTVTVSTSARAASMRSHEQDTLSSLRSQVIGALNAGTMNYAAAASASGCDATDVFGLAFSGCATVSYPAPTQDNATATGNLELDVTLEAWLPGRAGAKLADTATSFQTYGTCVVGYVPGTGTGLDNPVVYEPCKADTAPAQRFMVWVARDSGQGTPNVS